MSKNKTKLTDLYRDIWFEIFAYFYADELFYSFVYISNEINSILFSANHHLRFHVRIDDDESTTKILSHIDPSQIISLSIEEIEDNQMNLSGMISLQSVRIFGSNSDQWMEKILKQLILLKKIKKISLSLCYDDRGSYLLDLVLRIPGLKQFHFKDRSNWETNYYYQPKISSKILSIKTIHWDFYCEFVYVKKILFYLPNLRFLRLKLLRGDEYSNQIINDLIFNQIKKVHLTLCDVSFDRIISFFQTMLIIEIISLDGYIWGTNIISYFRSEKWMEILNINQRKKQIFVDLDLRQDYSNLSGDNIGMINYNEFEKMGLQITFYTIKGVINQ